MKNKKVTKKAANKRPKKGIRLWVQILFAALTNGYVNGFIQSKIYTGPTKALCVCRGLTAIPVPVPWEPVPLVPFRQSSAAVTTSFLFISLVF